MTVPVSVVPQVRAYLLNAITAQINVANFKDPIVEVFDGEPDPNVNNDYLLVGGVHRQTPVLAMVGGGGQGWLQEVFSVAIGINCVASNVDGAMTAANTRAYAVLACVEAAVRQDPSLGGLVLQANPVDSDSVPSWLPDHSGAECVINSNIHVVNTL